MPINHKKKLIFIHIPKCAGTSIEKMLDMSTPFSYFSNYGAKDRAAKLSGIRKSAFATDDEYILAAVKNRQHLTFRELKKALNLKNLSAYKVFSLVRNPYTRLVSEYEFCMVNKGLSFRTDFPTFNAFVQSQLDLPLLERITKYDGHLETQTSYLLNDSEDLTSINTIYRFESISEVMADLQQYSPVKGVIATRQGAYDRKYSSYYTDEVTLNKVKTFYTKDFELFNYDPDVMPV